jgi:hypothetical protein
VLSIVGKPLSIYSGNACSHRWFYQECCNCLYKHGLYSRNTDIVPRNVYKVALFNDLKAWNLVVLKSTSLQSQSNQPVS